jgi:hypothetical protein
MDWQLPLVVVLVVLALVYLGRQTLRTWRGKSSGCGSCKCGGAAKTAESATPDTLIPVEQVTLRRR